MDEADRLAALRRHNLLDTAPEPSFDRIVAQVRDVCQVPIALVSLVDAERQWFKAKVGVTVDQTPIDTSVCALAIRQRDVFEIEDLSRDERTSGMSLVTGEPRIRFYAGAPLVGSDGAALGSLCAIDTRSRPGGLDRLQRTTLSLLAEQVARLIEVRTAIAARDAALANDEAWRRTQVTERRFHAMVDSAIDNGLISFDADRVVTSWSRGAEHLFGWTAAEMVGDRSDKLFTPEDRAAGVVAREFETARAAGRASDERWHLRKDGSRFYGHGAMTPLVGAGEEGFVQALRDVTAEHENRAALSASREKLELATRAARMGQFDFYPQTNDLEWDDRCRELFGLSPGVPVTYEGSYLAGLHPDDRDRGASGVLAALDPGGGRTFDLEYRTIGIEDGIERHIHAKGTTLFDGDTALRLIGTVQDVSAERRARLVLHETEERLRLAARATNDAIWDWDLARDHIVWNDALEQMYGHAPDRVDPTGAWWMEHIHPEDRERVDRSIQAVIGGRDSDWTEDYRFRRGDGGFADVRDRGFVLRDEAGRPVRMIGAMLDQTERKRVERALRSQATDLAQQVAIGEAQIERLWAASPDLMVVLDHDGVFRRVNPAWTAILGYASADLVGRHVTEFVLEENHGETIAAYEAAASGQQIAAFNRYRHKDGSVRFISWVAAPNGGMIYATGRDVTAETQAREALRQTEEALRQSQKVEAIGQLTGGVAHDFNNLLTVIRGSVDLLRRPGLQEERRTRYIEAIADTTERAMRLTSQLLAFARRSALQPQVIDARRNVEALAPMLRALTGSRITTDYELGHLPQWVSADPSQFDTAIVNMAVNARDAMDGEGSLTIRVEAVDEIPAVRGHPAVKGPHVAIAITDTGAGIAPDRIEHIFEPFFTTKEAGHGTGLGLSQVFGFAKQSRGEVAVRSEVGQGATFTIYLPVVRPSQEPETVPAAPRALLRQGACVLVVEDNREVGEFATQALSELGYSSRWVPGVERALEVLAEEAEAIDVVFTDVVMPGRSGIELAEEIARSHPHMPVVLTSGYSHVLAQDGPKGLPLLHKPYSIDELAKVLQSVAQRG